MAKKIEILENTLLKLIVRQGTNADRALVTLSEGELGYTTDWHRLYVGDSQTQGGHVVGNLYKGAVADHTSLTTEIENGDYVFNTTNNTLFIKNSTAAGWLSAARILEAADGTITIDDSAGTIAVGTLSAGDFDADALGNSLELVGGRISLSAGQIKTDIINTDSATHLSLPQKLKINAVDYDFPVGGLANNAFLGTDSSGRLNWSAPLNTASLYFNSSAAIPIGTVVAAASGATIPVGWLKCDGQLVAGADYPDLSAAIGSQYGGGAVNFRVPDYTDVVHVGTDEPIQFTNSTLTSTGSATYTTKGVVYIIKSLADTITTSSVTFGGGLTAQKAGVDFTDTPVSVFDSDVKIGLPIPGIETFTASTALSTSGRTSFTTKAEYTKVWVTGSGAKGGNRTGGAAATSYAILSAPIGTIFDVYVAAGQTVVQSDGLPSKIAIGGGGADLVVSDGADYYESGTTPPNDRSVNSGTIATSNYIVGGYIIPGGRGGWRTVNNDEEVGATASYWGADNVPGAGSGAFNEATIDTVDGLVKFEWGM
tara:strand:+ start:16354 stop:17970 length:1617 start_codon:yes stop_codon:yes gene_type:complete